MGRLRIALALNGGSMVFRCRLLVGSVILAMFATAAAGQDELVELSDDFVVPTLNTPVNALRSYNVVTENGDYVGDFTGVVGPDEASPTHAIVEFDGPGIDILDTDVARLVPLSELDIEGERLVISITEDEIRNLTVYQD